MKELLRLAGYLRPYLGRMIAAAAMLAIGGALMAVAISAFKPMINEVLLPAIEQPAADPTTPGGMDLLATVKAWLPLERLGEWGKQNALLVPLIMIVIFLVRGIFLYFGNYFTIRAGTQVIRDLRTALYESVAFQSLSFYQDHSTGVILSRIMNDVARLQRASTTMLADLIRVAATVPAILIISFLTEWRLSVLAFVVLPLLGYPMVRLGRRMRRAATTSQESMALVTERLKESIDGVRVVQGFGKERFEIGRFREAIELMLRADLKAARAVSLAPAIMELLGAIAGAGLFYFAGLYIARGSVDAGGFATVLVALGYLFASIKRLNLIYSEMQISRSAAVRVFTMLDEERVITDRPDAVELQPFQRSILFENVHFGYDEGQVLDGIRLEIPKGQRVALVGASGSGKTTLANLLPRFYDPTKGAVRIDGRDVREVTLASLRRQIGIVTQETVLFDDTVRNNIAYGMDGQVAHEAVVEAARAAFADEFIETMPERYETRLGERGQRLSMGQRQRLTIARALLRDPPILILDEATSALDAESESAVQEALEHLMEGRTSLVIAHRLATVRGADRILVMHQGRIVEEGTHQELLDRGGVYTRLYDLQFSEAEG
ncbi:MAG: ATP-binding cassette domain-containing protein [Acidobacteria bacterium]|nr:ATP-binding cassette domain-containing protein [Acidobacteriota bacterium]NIM63237.1 ATP-binding cassette domain-containing protein [Acidobacteriota bacterium]NIO61015.1 ATP-binding cassette domain-containing protein [Acidobacteriota bacterium]NIQ87524.1 ATP-binding cassette domain-containing protein [Acidobacteriota bacterium]NIT12652.1 ATP-binding cassette domain-containing protein [Acidobacteriota bacterium]